jgi:hypothetical protein
MFRECWENFEELLVLLLVQAVSKEFVSIYVQLAREYLLFIGFHLRVSANASMYNYFKATPHFHSAPKVTRGSSKRVTSPESVVNRHVYKR